MVTNGEYFVLWNDDFKIHNDIQLETVVGNPDYIIGSMSKSLGAAMFYKKFPEISFTQMISRKVKGASTPEDELLWKEYYRLNPAETPL
jgi:hypothetical protein